MKIPALIIFWFFKLFSFPGKPVGVKIAGSHAAQPRDLSNGSAPDITKEVCI